MKDMFESLRLTDLPERNCGVIRGQSNTRPILWAIEENGTRAIVKDYSTNGFLYRNLIGRFLVWRESRALTRLGNLEGVPVLYRVIGGLALVIEEISGRNMEDMDRDKKLPAAFFRDLGELVQAVHDCGFAHCDLKRAPNILLGDNGRPHIVDWSASLSEGECRLSPLKYVYRRFLLDDFNAIVKLQLRHAPELVAPEDRRRYYHRGFAERCIRGLRDRGRDLLQKIA